MLVQVCECWYRCVSAGVSVSADVCWCWCRCVSCSVDAVSVGRFPAVSVAMVWSVWQSLNRVCT